MRSPMVVPPGWRSDDGIVAAASQPCRQTLDLRGFARTVESFERDKNTARHGQSLPPGMKPNRLYSKADALCVFPQRLKPRPFKGCTARAVRAMPAATDNQVGLW